MEKDGRTRLYYYRDHPYEVSEAWPQPQSRRDKDSWTKGGVAEEKVKSADFTCVSVRGKDEGYWVVSSADNGDRFEVKFLGSGAENYTELAQQLEKRSGKKGLTVVIC